MQYKVLNILLFLRLFVFRFRQSVTITSLFTTFTQNVKNDKLPKNKRLYLLKTT